MQHPSAVLFDLLIDGGLMKVLSNKAKSGYGSRLAKREAVNGYLFVFPVILVLAVLVVYPLCYGFYISLFKTNLVKKWNYVGFKYYLSAFSDPDFREQLVVTLKFTVFVVLGHFICGMLFAVLLNRKIKGRTFFRILLLLPWLFPDSVIALLFKWIFNSVYGVFNQIMLSLGFISQNMSWLGNSATALPVVVAVCIWKGYPMIMMMILAGLQSIPIDIVEAAKMDGASNWKVFRHITIPCLKPVLLITLVLDTVWWFKHYTLVWVLTQGGPGNDTALVSIAIYKLAFEQFNFGKAAAFSVIVFFLCFIIGAVYRRLLDYDD